MNLHLNDRVDEWT